MNDYNATVISIGVVICGAMFLLFPYLRDYTQFLDRLFEFFDRLFGTMEPEDYYKEKNYIGLYRRFKHCTAINGLGWTWKTSAEIAEICRIASLASSERWSDLANPDVVSALAFLASMGIVVDVWAKRESADTCSFRIHLYYMDTRHRKMIIDKYQDEYCSGTISSQRLIQFTNELKEDIPHVE